MSIGRGQWAADLAPGFCRSRVLRVVVLPQALRVMAPSFVNPWCALIEDTSRASVIGVPALSVATARPGRSMVAPGMR